MNSGKGRGRFSYKLPLRKPGETVQASEAVNEEKPPVQASAITEGNQPEQDNVEKDISVTNEEPTINNPESQVNKANDVLLRAVNNPEFVPRSFSSSILPSAVHAREFIPGEPFHKYEETATERADKIKTFVSGKIYQVKYDPGLLEEISSPMSTYLSESIKNEDDMKVTSDLLFDMCLSEQNFQYTGSRLANHLDKNLTPHGLPDKCFRTVFLKRCQVENEKVSETIQNRPDRVSNFALFLGELLLNYKTVGGNPIEIFFVVVLNIIESLLASDNRSLLICAGKLLKLTGSVLDDNQEQLFQKVAHMASNPNVDRTARDLFTRVCVLRNTNWGKDEKPSQTTHASPASVENLQATSLYLPDFGSFLEEQYDAVPVVTQEQWNEFVVDGEEDNSEEDDEELYKRISLEQYGYYTPYATADDKAMDDIEEDYDEDYESFLRTTNNS